MTGMSGSVTVAITDETLRLATEVQSLVVVDFWAPWCAPCRAIAPVIERLAGDYAGRVTFAKLNVDENADSALRFQVQSIPALLFFRDGVVVDRTVGALPESILKQKIEQLLAKAVGASNAA